MYRNFEHMAFNRLNKIPPFAARFSVEPQQLAKNRSDRIIYSCIRPCGKKLRPICATCAVPFGGLYSCMSQTCQTAPHLFHKSAWNFFSHDRMYEPRLLANTFLSNSSGSAENPAPAIYGGILFRLLKAMLENYVYLKNHYLFFIHRNKQYFCWIFFFKILKKRVLISKI